MRKFYPILLTAGLCVFFAGCGNTGTAQREKAATEIVAHQSTELPKVNDKNLKAGIESTETVSGSSGKPRILIAYFTRADNIGIDPEVDAVSSASINKEGASYEGNLAILADYIKEVTGGDTFSLTTAEYYPTRYRDTTNAAKKERNDEARPKLSSHVKNMEDYDVVFLGYPNWWGGLPMPVHTFLEEYDFSGKVIIPFASHEGSGLGSGPSEIAESCPKAQVLDGFAARGSEVRSSKERVRRWLDGMNLEHLRK